jgi:hypothetical protein
LAIASLIVITTPTTLILGAGASVAFGYPIGEKLRDRILATIEKGNGLYTAAQAAGFSQEKIESFANDFADSQRKTIDDFLEYRTDLQDIGRFAIAHELTMWENGSLRKVSTDSWPYLLLHKLGNRLDEVHNNPLKIATFNYDRALEQYLSQSIHALHRSHPDTVGVATTLAHAFSFLHLHGMLSALPWQTGAGRPYKFPENPSVILETSRGILFTHDQSNGEPTWPDSQSLSQVLPGSKKILFFGFGFAESNLRKLCLDSISNSSDIFFGASAVDLPEETKARVQRQIPKIQFFPSIEKMVKEL